MMKRIRRWWAVGFIALAAGSIFTFGSRTTWAGAEDEPSQETQMKDDDSAKEEGAATTDASKEEAPTAGETGQSGEKDQ